MSLIVLQNEKSRVVVGGPGSFYWQGTFSDCVYKSTCYSMCNIVHTASYHCNAHGPNLNGG